MTDVGKISLGVDIDADGLAARLGEAVRTAIAPALAQITAELNKVEREYDRTAKRADKANAAQTAGAKAVAEAVERVGTEQQKAAAKTQAASGLSTRSINSVTRALDRQALAWQRLAAAQTAAAAAPQPSAPAGGGGGTRGPPGAGVNAGGFMRGGKGRFGFLTSPVGLGGISLAAQALPAAMTGVVNLTGAVQQLGQAGLVLPGIYAGAAASIGTMVIGFKGMGDAVKALNEAAKSGDPKDLEKAAEAMKDMDPAAQAVAKTVSGLSRGPLLEMQKMLAGRMLKGFDQDLQGLADRALPRVSGGMGKIADGWNSTLKALTGSLGSDKNLGLVDRILGNTGDAQQRFSKAVDPIVHGLGTLVAGSSDALPRLIDGLTKGAERFDAFITKADSDGRLKKWIDEGIDGARNLGNAMLNIAKTITDLTRAAGGDGGFLKWLNDATARMREFTSSAEGQRKLGDFFKGGREDMRQWGDLLSTLGPILLHVLEGFATWGEILLPIISALSEVVAALDQIPGLLQAVVVGFLAWRTLGPIISGLTTKLGAMGTAAAAAGGGAGGPAGKGGKGRFAGKGNALLMGGSLLAAGTATQITAGDSGGQQALGALTTIGSGALLGGTIGSVVPGVGTAIGAGVGAAVGTAIAGVNFLLGENAQKAKEAADAQAAYQASLDQSREALLNLQGAQKGVNDSLLEAGGNLADQGVQTGIQGQLEALPESLKSHFGEDQAKGFSDSLVKLGLTNEELAQQISGSQPVFDALSNNLKMLGPDGFFAATQLQQMRDQIMGMQQTAQVAGPAMQTLAGILQTDVAGAAAVVRTSVQSIPQDVPINVGMPNADATVEMLKGLGYQIDIVDGKPIVLNADDQKVKDADAALEALGIKITHLPTGEIAIHIDQAAYTAAQNDMNSFFNQYQRLIISPQVQAPPGSPAAPVPNQNPLLVPFGPPKAGGGVLPGWSPGRDNMLVPMAGGEGVLIPQAARALGGAAGINAINSIFRRGYATGGVIGFQGGGEVPHLGTGAPPGPETELDLLRQIRDLLAGKGGGSTPLNTTASNTSSMADATKTAMTAGGNGTEPGRMGPFGTPIKARNRGYEMAAAAIQALGGDPEKFLGPDPVAYMEQQLGAASSSASSALPGGGGMVAGNPANFAAALSAFAASGNLQDVLGLGLDANDPVVKAIVSARNKKKGGLDDAAIGGLVDQVLSGGGFTGVLDESNTSLVSALQTFREKVLKGKIGAVPGTSNMVGNNATGLNWQALAQAESGGDWAINSGNGYFGGLQFDQATWDAYKPQGAPARADMATPEQQIAAAQNAINQRGGPESLWPQNYKLLGGGGGAMNSALNRATSTTAFPGGGHAKVTGASGLLPAAESLLQAVQTAFPQVTEIGGVRSDAHPDHPSGRALDIMIPGGDTHGGANPAGKALGDQIWQWLMSTGIVDPQGSLWQTDTGGNHFNHIHARIAEGMENQAAAAGLLPGGTTGLPGAAGGQGTPVFVTNWPGGGAGGLGDMLKGVTGAGIGAIGEAGINVGSDIGKAVAGIGQEEWVKRAPNVGELSTLVKERNPLALAKALGFDVEDFTREGGAGTDVEQNQGPGFDASGRMFSDTSALFDRTLTSLTAQLTAMREQMVDVITQVQQRLEEQALEPVVKAGVQAALEDLKSSVSSTIGTALGDAAAPPIADAVSSAVASLPIDNSGAGSTGNDMAGAATGALGNLFAGGGPVSGGTPGKDSVPAWLMPGEWVLNKDDVARLGGYGGVARITRGMRGYATGGGVIGNDTVGAEFFGVSEVPVISTIVNLLVRVLLQVIGVEIEVRDTLNEMSTDFRTFRGDAFKAFDAQGRLMNDTSALIERSATSEETAAEERIRILKIVIQAIIKYIIEKVIVPITKAVANAAIQAGASAAGAAVNTQAPGAGGIVSSLISSAGQAGVEIAAEIGTDFALAMSEQLIDVVAEGLQGAFPDLVTGIFSGAGLANLFDPAGGFLTTLLGGLLSAFTVLLGGGVLGGASTLIPGIPFDEGGMASGMGYLPKATMDDELVLSPGETDLFTRFVRALEAGGFGGGNKTVHAPITVLSGGPETAEQVENRLLKLMP